MKQQQNVTNLINFGRTKTTQLKQQTEATVQDMKLKTRNR